MARSKKGSTTPKHTAPTLAFLRESAPIDTVTIDCLDGTTGASLDGLQITVASMWSPAGRSAQIRAARKVRSEHPDAGSWDTDVLQDVIERWAIAYAVQSWNVTDGDKPFPATPEAVFDVLSIRGDVFAQVKHGYTKGRGFFAEAAPTP